MYLGLLLGAFVCAQQEDETIVEQGDPEMTPEQLENQPEVDELPPWLIDIQPGTETETQTVKEVKPVEYVVEDKHVVSQSRMFSVSGGDVLRMGAMASHADDVRKHLNRLLGMDDTWKYGIVTPLASRSSNSHILQE